MKTNKIDHQSESEGDWYAELLRVIDSRSGQFHLEGKTGKRLEAAYVRVIQLEKDIHRLNQAVDRAPELSEAVSIRIENLWHERREAEEQIRDLQEEIVALS
jgi:hypothetical protein